jgi:hypothetical protein
MVNGRNLLIVSNLVTIAVTACAVLFALHNEHTVPGSSMFLGRELQTDDCCDCTTGGPLAPTDSPTSAPIGFFACFTAGSTVQVLQDNDAAAAEVLMKDVHIGDVVHVGNGKYERVYSFGHYAPSSTGDNYVQLSVAGTNKKLTLTSDHLVWAMKSGKTGAFLAASQVEVGDELLRNDSDIVKVEAVQQGLTGQGLLAPFTPSGTIVVDGFLTSSFIDAVKHHAPLLGAGAAQWAAHSFEFPHRLACHYFGNECVNETYNEHGVSTWVAAPFEVGKWVLNQNLMIKYGLLSMFFFVMAAFNVVEFACFQYTFVAMACLVGGYVYHINRPPVPARKL